MLRSSLITLNKSLFRQPIVTKSTPWNKVIACNFSQKRYRRKCEYVPRDNSKILESKERQLYEIDPNIVYDDDEFERVLTSIDPTLTPEQQAYVDDLKRQMKGNQANNSVNYYLNVVPKKELEKIFLDDDEFPKVHPNAQALIDFALSHIPKRDGYRGSRQKKRMDIRHKVQRLNHLKVKEGNKKAAQQKVIKHKKVYDEIKAIKQQAQTLLEIKTMKAKLLEKQ